VFSRPAESFTATRYHSLIVERKSSRRLAGHGGTDDDIIMGMQHKHYALMGVQFHPESVLTDSGKQLLKNFLSL